MRGNRTVKLDNSALEAFDSPNMIPLARMAINIQGISTLGLTTRLIQLTMTISSEVIPSPPSLSKIICAAMLAC